ncbi:MAG: hypothetical protein B6229_10955 [Spirochaetaceae bacterium 4572_7]|nr:MAG: hypothetical protein B6229_10955 [Spirochaetaceae bacterium 4572_7]
MNSVVTVVGKDSVGIIYKVSGIMADNKINILDISQTIMEGYFTMIMVVEISESTKDIKDIRSLLDTAGKNLGVSINIQHEQVYQAMQRI